MTIKQMQTFAAVCREGTVVAAAEKLYVAQSAVSRTLREISDRYGITLFDHVGGRLRPTDTARQLLEDVNEILERYQAMEDRLTAGGYVPALHIGCSMSTGAALLPAAIAAFEEEHPRVSLHIEENSTAEIEARVLRGDLDFALITGAIHDPRLVQESFVEERLCWVCHAGDPILREGRVDLRRLSREKLYLPGADIGGDELLARYAMEEGVVLEPVWTTVNVTAMLEAVLSGRGIALISEKVVRPHVDRGVLAVIPTNMEISRQMGVIRLRKKNLPPEALAFIEICRRAAAAL